jgi:putative membrane protein
VLSFICLLSYITKKLQQSIFRLILLVSIHVFLITGAYFAITPLFTKNVALISTCFITILLVATACSFVNWSGKKGVLILIFLGLFALTIETFALLTGFPYGHFFYNTKASLMFLQLVPITTPFAWIIILLGCSALVTPAFTTSPWRRRISTCILIVWVDLLLDPVAVNLGLWQWKEPGIYYGVPAINYVGWILSSLLGVLLSELCIKKFNLTFTFPLGLLTGFYFLFIFLLSIAFLKILILPFLIGLIFLYINRHSLFKAAQKFVYA